MGAAAPPSRTRSAPSCEAIAGRRQGDREPVLRPAGVRHRRSAGHHEGGPAPDERPRHPLGHPGLCRRSSAPRATEAKQPGRGHLHGLPQPLHGVRPGRGRGLRRQRHPRAHLRVPAPHAGAVASPCGTTAARRASTSPPATTPRSTTATRSTGPTARSCRPSTPPPSPHELEQIDVFTGVQPHGLYDEAKAPVLSTLMGEETDETFMANVMAMINDRGAVAKVADTLQDGLHPLPRLRLEARARRRCAGWA